MAIKKKVTAVKVVETTPTEPSDTELVTPPPKKARKSVTASGEKETSKVKAKAKPKLSKAKPNEVEAGEADEVKTDEKPGEPVVVDASQSVASLAPTLPATTTQLLKVCDVPPNPDHEVLSMLQTMSLQDIMTQFSISAL